MRTSTRIDVVNPLATATATPDENAPASIHSGSIVNPERGDGGATTAAEEEERNGANRRRLILGRFFPFSSHHRRGKVLLAASAAVLTALCCAAVVVPLLALSATKGGSSSSPTASAPSIAPSDSLVPSAAATPSILPTEAPPTDSPSDRSNAPSPTPPSAFPTTQRRGVAVVADFADNAIEHYSGPWLNAGALTDVADVRVILDAMASHWEYMCLGKETFVWDIIRIALDETLSPDAFATWQGYREAVASKVLEAVDVSSYDLDGDGDVDAAFVVASNDAMDYGYLVGGTSSNGNVTMFVDHQDSLSIRGPHTGNFNHEVGHCLGLRDVYGPYDTVKHLTSMSGSWVLPPNVFSAWERFKLNWLSPLEIRRNQSGVVLFPAEEHLEAAMVYTHRASEYFLLEYRKKPEQGYGSAPSEEYDGLAIYHVWEGAPNGNRDPPPLIRLETPDGMHRWNSPPTVNDFWFPGNAVGDGVFIGRPYYDESAPIVKIDNFGWISGNDGSSSGIQFDVTLYDLRLSNHSSDPIKNGGFETAGEGVPSHWTAGAWDYDRSSFGHSMDLGVGGSACASIESDEPNDAWFEQTVTGLVVGQRYRVGAMLQVAWIDMGDSNTGASISRIGTWDHSPATNEATTDWTEVELVFEADATVARVGCRLGYWASPVSGRLLCDNFSIEWVL